MSRRLLVTGDRARRHVEDHRRPGDVVLDAAALLAALVVPSPPGYGWRPAPEEGHGRLVALAALASARRRAEKLHEDVRVWLIHPDPTPAQLAGYLAAGYLHHDTGPWPPGQTRSGGPATGTAAEVAATARRNDTGSSLPRSAHTDGGRAR